MAFDMAEAATTRLLAVTRLGERAPPSTPASEMSATQATLPRPSSNGHCLSAAAYKHVGHESQPMEAWNTNVLARPMSSRPPVCGTHSTSW